MPDDQTAPDAELLIAPGCAHCPAVLAHLTELVKQGLIGRLTVVNIASHPEVAATYRVRGVPWIRIGPFELVGAHERRQLAAWAQRAASNDGRRTYLSETLAGGQLDTALAACRRQPALLTPLLQLAGDLETPLAVRVGIGAVLEELGPEGLLRDHLDDLRRLAASPQPQVRADAAHYLGLVGGAAARATLEPLTRDSDREVREIATETLAELGTD